MDDSNHSNPNPTSDPPKPRSKEGVRAKRKRERAKAYTRELESNLESAYKRIRALEDENKQLKFQAEQYEKILRTKSRAAVATPDPIDTTNHQQPTNPIHAHSWDRKTPPGNVGGTNASRNDTAVVVRTNPLSSPPMDMIPTIDNRVPIDDWKPWGRPLGESLGMDDHFTTLGAMALPLTLHQDESWYPSGCDPRVSLDDDSTQFFKSLAKEDENELTENLRYKPTGNRSL